MALDVRTAVVIGRPIDIVSSYAADPTNAPDWCDNIEAVEWRTPPLVLGSQMVFVAHFTGRRLACTYEVVELVPGERLVQRTAEGPVLRSLHGRTGQVDRCRS